jgi:hypothetical protein
LKIEECIKGREWYTLHNTRRIYNRGTDRQNHDDAAG